MSETTLAMAERQDSVQLIRRYQEAHDPAALNALFERYRDRVVRIANIRMGASVSIHDADDLVQETFLAALKAFDGFELREDGQLINWLARIAERKLIDLLKHEHRPKRDCDRLVHLEEQGAGKGGDSTSGFDLADDKTGVAERVERDELGAILDQSLSQLEERHREVIVLRDYAMGSWQLVAEEMGLVSAEAARKLYSRARVALASLLQGRI